MLGLRYTPQRSAPAALALVAVHGAAVSQSAPTPRISRISNAQVDGTPVHQVEDLLSAVEERQAGEAVTLRVLRGCDPLRNETLKVRLGSARRRRRVKGP